jgi:2-keto-4-pentenoate hydratase/2-oxohepta-3-ene-1,7-dioic acid hydratase in catechol pathway
MADYDAPDVLRAGAVAAIDGVRLCAPVPRPGKIVAVVDNYATDAAPHAEPSLVLEAPNAVTGPRDAVPLPRSLREVDFGGALGCVIGRRARCVDAADAFGYVAGYLPVLDLAGANADRAALGRSFDSSLPCGPALVTADEIDDPGALVLRTVVSGEPFQDASTKEMRLSIGAILARASELLTLEPGDLLVTGSPAGAMTRTPPRWLREGDVVEVEIEGLGRLCNDIVSEPTASG